MGDSSCLKCLFRIHICSLEDLSSHFKERQFGIRWKILSDEKQQQSPQGVTGVYRVILDQNLNEDDRNDYSFINHWYQNSLLNIQKNSSNECNNNNNNNNNNQNEFGSDCNSDGSCDCYRVSFDEHIEYVAKLKWNAEALENVSLSPLHECLLQMDLCEHKDQNIQVLAQISANLVEFTTSYSQTANIELQRQYPAYNSTPQHALQAYIRSSSSLKRTVLFPIEIKNEKLIKLRVTISSVWINEQQQQPKKPLAKLNTYFIVDEEAQVLLPSYLSSASNAQMSLRMMQQKVSDDRRAKMEDGFSTPDKSASINEVNYLNSSISPIQRRESIEELESSKLLNDSFEKNEMDRLVHSLTKVRKQLESELNEIQQFVSKFEARLDQLFAVLENIEAEKAGLCRQDPLEQMMPLTGGQKATDVFKTIVFCDLHASDQLYKLGLSNNEGDMIRSLDIYYNVLRDCMKQCCGTELTNFTINKKQGYKRLSLVDKIPAQELEPIVQETEAPANNLSISDTIICAFESTKQAIRFTLQVHLRLLEADWPASLLELDGMMVQYANAKKKNSFKSFIYRGLRCRMAVDTKISSRSLLATVKRASFLARYTHGGQTLVTADTWQSLQIEKEVPSPPTEEPRIRTLVQDLGDCVIDGFGHSEKIWLIIPERFKGREFKEVGLFSLQQSSLINILCLNLEEIQYSILNDIRLRLAHAEEAKYQLQGLVKILEGTIGNNGNIFNSILKEFTEKQSIIIQEINSVKQTAIDNIQQKVKAIEKDLLKLSAQFLTAQNQRKAIDLRSNALKESKSALLVSVADLLQKVQKQNTETAYKIQTLFTEKSH
jgi:hypothetical protein